MFGSFVHCHTKAKTQRANLSRLTPRSPHFRPDLGDSPPIKMTPSRWVRHNEADKGCVPEECQNFLSYASVLQDDFSVVLLENA